MLPIALLLVLALGALSGSILVFARGELLLERGNLRYVERRVASEAGLAFAQESSGGPLPPEWIPLGGGFVLARSPRGGPRPPRGTVAPLSVSPMSVVFRLHPDSVASSLAALEVAHSPPTGGVALGDDGCHGPEGSEAPPLIRVRVTWLGPEPDPSVPPPRIGPLGLEELGQLGAVELSSGGALESPDGAAILRAPPGATYETGEGVGVLMSHGDLTLEGDASFQGVVLTGGDLHLGGAARIEGAVVTGGTARISEEAQILGCQAQVSAALDQDGLAGLHPLPTGSLLGRF